VWPKPRSTGNEPPRQPLAGNLGGHEQGVTDRLGQAGRTRFIAPLLLVAQG
jgi:hypothetical protein